MHCIACGSKLPEHPPTRCPACGTPAWVDAKPCACALVEDPEGRLLLIKRASEPWKGHWDIPGGFCEPGEHPIWTAERETREETGLSVRVTEFLGIWLAPYDDPATPEASKQTMDIFYKAAFLEVTDTPDAQEVEQVAWFHPDQLPDSIAFPEAQQPALAAWVRSQTQPVSLPDRP